jgi:hypothetical protein
MERFTKQHLDMIRETQVLIDAYDAIKSHPRQLYSTVHELVKSKAEGRQFGDQPQPTHRQARRQRAMNLLNRFYQYQHQDDERLEEEDAAQEIVNDYPYMMDIDTVDRMYHQNMKQQRKERYIKFFSIGMRQMGNRKHYPRGLYGGESFEECLRRALITFPDANFVRQYNTLVTVPNQAFFRRAYQLNPINAVIQDGQLTELFQDDVLNSVRNEGTVLRRFNVPAQRSFIRKQTAGRYNLTKETRDAGKVVGELNDFVEPLDCCDYSTLESRLDVSKDIHRWYFLNPCFLRAWDREYDILFQLENDTCIKILIHTKPQDIVVKPDTELHTELQLDQKNGINIWCDFDGDYFYDKNWDISPTVGQHFLDQCLSL